jgi:hypothetical protein
LPHRIVTVEPYDKNISESSRRSEIAHMTHVQYVETAVREYNRLAFMKGAHF